MQRRLSRALFTLVRILVATVIVGGPQHWHLLPWAGVALCIQCVLENVSSIIVVLRSGRVYVEQDDRLFFGLVHCLAGVVRPVWLDHPHQSDARILAVPIRQTGQLPFDLIYCGVAVFGTGQTGSISANCITTLFAALLAMDINRTSRYWLDEWPITASWCVLLFVAGCIHDPGFTWGYLLALLLGYILALLARTMLKMPRITTNHMGIPWSAIEIRGDDDLRSLMSAVRLSLPWHRMLSSNPRDLISLVIDADGPYSDRWLHVVESLLIKSKKAVIEVSFLNVSEGVKQELQACKQHKIPTLLVFDPCHWTNLTMELERLVGETLEFSDWFSVKSFNGWRVCCYPLRDFDSESISSSVGQCIRLRHLVMEL